MADLASHSRSHEEAVAESERVRKAATMWNLVASLTNALTSVILLFVLTRVTSLEVAGIFSIAYANANLWLNLGKYGLRQYQVSDWNERFSFREYWANRLISTALMIVAGLLWLAYAMTTTDYSDYKIAVVAVMILFKAVDSVEDVYHARYQQQGQLDVAAMLLALRLGTTIVLFSALAAVTRDLLSPLVVSTVYTFVFWAIGVLWARHRYEFARVSGRLDMRKVFEIFRVGFPLLVEVFMLFYIGNAPKYAIDAVMNDSAQAIFNFIAMPIFVVSLVASTIFNTVILEFTSHWHEGKRQPFMKMLRRQLRIIALITVVCDAACALLGVPVMSFLFNTDLSPYWWELLILMTGGGFAALSGFLGTVLAVVRQQKWLAIGYIPSAVLAFLLSGFFVSQWGLMGASWVYFIGIALPAVFFAVVVTRVLNAPGAFSPTDEG